MPFATCPNPECDNFGYNAFEHHPYGDRRVRGRRYRRKECMGFIEAGLITEAGRQVAGFAGLDAVMRYKALAPILQISIAYDFKPSKSRNLQ